jgi:hypothetical protein
MSTTHFQLLRTQGHVFYSDSPLFCKSTYVIHSFRAEFYTTKMSFLFVKKPTHDNLDVILSIKQTQISPTLSNKKALEIGLLYFSSIVKHPKVSEAGGVSEREKYYIFTSLSRQLKTVHT